MAAVGVIHLRNSCALAHFCCINKYIPYTRLMKISDIVFVFILTSAFVCLGRCDDFDDYVGRVVRDLHVRGAAIAFFDAVSGCIPVPVLLRKTFAIVLA